MSHIEFMKFCQNHWSLASIQRVHTSPEGCSKEQQLRRMPRSSVKFSVAQQGATQHSTGSVHHSSVVQPRSERAGQLRRVQLNSDMVQQSSGGCSVAQYDASQLTRVQRSSQVCSVAPQSEAQLRRVHQSTVGCSIPVAQKGASQLGHSLAQLVQRSSVFSACSSRCLARHPREVLLADQASDEESQETSAAIRKCRGSALAFLPVVNCFNPSSAFRHQGQPCRALCGLVRHCPALVSPLWQTLQILVAV